MEQSGIGKWETRGFEAFASGTFGNGGQNLFVSAAGVLQRIFQYDVNNDGWPDLLFANSQSMFERPPLHLYEFLPELQTAPGGERKLRRLRTDQRGELAANGCQTAILADLSGNGINDLIIASRHNGTHSDNSSMIYYGSATGFSERYRVELPTSTAYDVAAGDFNGDGRLDLVFACEAGLMLFYQTPLGIDGAARVDLNLQVTSVAAADLDGDGYDDLYIKLTDGRAAVMWGGNGGLCAERMTFLPVQADEAALGAVGTASTAGRAMLEQWRCEILEFTGGDTGCAEESSAENAVGCVDAGRKLLFAADGDDVVLFACSAEREFGECLRLNCPEAQHAALADLNEDGVPELIVATSAERNDPGITFIFWGEAASAAEAEPTALPKYGYDAVTRLITKGACYVRGITLNAGDTCLAIAQNPSAVNNTSNVHLLGFDADRRLLWRQAVPGGSPLRVLYDERTEQLIIPNREFNPRQGIEQIYVYLGGEDGYVPDRYLGLPGLSAVEGHIVDFNDDGRPDVIVVNCCEDASYKDRGCYIFYNRERDTDGTESSGAEHEDGVADEPDGTIVLEHAAYPPCTSEADLRSTYEGFDFHPSTISPAELGFDFADREFLPTIRSHGVAIGDFRRSGYLDIASGGFNNNEVRILHGSADGYSLENSTRLVLDESILVRAGLASSDSGATDGDETAASAPVVPPYRPSRQPRPALSEAEEHFRSQYGQTRWLLAADFDGDGWLDLFVSQIIGAHSFIFWGGPEGFSADRVSVLLTDGVASANAADLDGDGYLDLILSCHMSTRKTHRMESYVTIYWGGPDGYSEQRKLQLPATCANSVTVGDYRGRGMLDIFATSYNDGRFRDINSFLYEAQDEPGDYRLHKYRTLFSHSASGCVSGDFNGDGYTDLAVASHKEFGNHCSHSFIYWGGPDGLSEDRKTVLPTIGPHGMSTVNPGNIMDRSDSEFYYSAPFTLPTGATVRGLSWTGECTSVSSVKLAIRAVDADTDGCGGEFERTLKSAVSERALKEAAWIEVEAGADLSALDLCGVVQYRLELIAPCSCGTPRIESVTLSYG